MRRLQRNCLLAAVIIAIIAWCATLVPWDRSHEEPQRGTPGETICPLPNAASATRENITTLPQDIGPFAAAFHQTIRTEEQQRAALQFHHHYFAPWTATAPLFDLNGVTEGIQQLAAKTWYGENRQRVESTRIDQLVSLADLEHLPSRNQPGVVVKPAFIRILPTIRPFYETPDDFPFDHLQFAEIKPNEPVRILHASKDGAWLYIETSYANGWVEPDAVRTADATLQDRLMKAAHLVVVRDFAVMRTEQGTTLPQAKIGTLYPLVRDEADDWLVEVAVAADDRSATLTTARIAKSEARPHPLVFSPETVTLIGTELLKTPYGWGEVYRNRDCSATTRDFFLAFGLWLPRNSQKQISSGPSVSLAGLANADKETRIRDQAIPFRTLLHHRGHIMLYVGLHEGKPIILHTVWGFRYQPENCSEQKLIIGRTILSTLEAGIELPLSNGTMLDRLDAMLLLPVEE
jgi:hypothetical protein